MDDCQRFDETEGFRCREGVCFFKKNKHLTAHLINTLSETYNVKTKSTTSTVISFIIIISLCLGDCFHVEQTHISAVSVKVTHPPTQPLTHPPSQHPERPTKPQPGSSSHFLLSHLSVMIPFFLDYTKRRKHGGRVCFLFIPHHSFLKVPHFLNN